jgi:ATP-dependent Clp endopeptidase proteolytic subunit ClpP
MTHGARPLRSTRRLQLQNLTSALPKWYSVVRNQSGPTMVSIYDEIGFFGVSAADFMAEVSQIPGDIELHLNSPGGDVFDGIAIYNQLKAAQARGTVSIIVDGLAASAASFIAMAASPGALEMCPNARMMIHDGFGMAIGNAADMREMADLLDDASDNIASMYAERTGKPAAYWRAKMQTETWYSPDQAAADGLIDGIYGQKPKPSNAWDMSVFANADAAPGAPGDDDGSEKCPTCKGKGKIRDGHMTCPDCKGSGSAAPAGTPAADKAPALPRNADPAKATPVGPDGWVQDPDGKMRFDPDGDGDDDSTPEGDTDHDYFDADGKQLKPVPPKPDAPSAFYHYPVFDAVDSSAWDASKAWHNGAMSDDPAKFYAGICAGRKAGDPANQSSWALPYKYHPGDAPNAAGVKNALSRLPQTDGLTNADEAKATLQAAMKQVNPDYDPDALAVTPAVLASVFTIPSATVDHSMWDAKAALAAAAASEDPAAFYRGICAGRRPGDPSTPQAWALPYRYAPSLPPNSSGVRAALAQFSTIKDLANAGEARAELEKAMREVSPGHQPDEIDPQLLAAALGLGLEGAGK